LNEKSNVQFGEGGAGTFSDGKLKVGTKDKYKYRILDELIEGGGSPEILYSTTAHLGTDKLPRIVKHVREKIISLGGEVRFNTVLTDIEIKDGALVSVTLDNGTPYKLDANTLILALGHSARDTVKMLYSKGLSIEPKGFGIGLRIEHKREHINELIYGGGYDSALESASYHLVEHLPSGRSVYSFCMCPGGTVVPSAREAFGVVTNGMSAYARDGENSNAAFLVSVTPKDFGGSALGGFELQRELEEQAYKAGGGGYFAPASRMEDFLKGEKSSRLGDVAPTYPIGVTPTSHDSYLPEYITSSIREAIPKMNDWLPGFYEADAVLTGVETRSTSPIKMLRKECFESAFISGIYPVGEGAGYGGGIISSAYDGMRCADSIIKNHKD
ncbi:MAG: hypothetical protein IIX96_00390, partial [Clostridia bacterium]|nr:hypothetical protein [Clostridia bacterium]